MRCFSGSITKPKNSHPFRSGNKKFPRRVLRLRRQKHSGRPQIRTFPRYFAELGEFGSREPRTLSSWRLPTQQEANRTKKKAREMKGAELRAGTKSRKLNPGGRGRGFGEEEFGGIRGAGGFGRRGCWCGGGENELMGNAAEVCLVSPKFLNLVCYIPIYFPFSCALLFFSLCAA